VSGFTLDKTVVKRIQTAQQAFLELPLDAKNQSAINTNFGCITLMLQTTPGLEMETRNGEWIAAPPIDDTLVINVGDLLARWSDNRLPTNVHRVRNTSTTERSSIAMFHDPNPTEPSHQLT
jgi:isopenicillin N synthase-like dioxygenase